MSKGFSKRNGWRKVKLGDVAKLNYGKSLPKKTRVVGDSPVYSSAGLIDWHNEALVNERGLIIGRKGTAGSVYKSEMPFYPIDTTFYISESDTSCDLGYLFYRLSKLNLKKLNSDSAVPGLNRNTAYDQKILLPPLPEQKTIAGTLQTWDIAIEKTEALTEQYRTQKRGLMQKLFQAEGETVPKLRFSQFQDAGEWKKKKVNELGYFKSGNGFPTKYQGHKNGDFPFFKVSDMNNCGNATHMNVANNYISKDVAKKLSVNVIPENSIVFAKIGAAIFLERKKITVVNSCIDNNMMAFIPDHSLSNYRFFHYLFLHFGFGKLVAGTALPSLSPNDIGRLALNFPEKDEQKTIADTLQIWDMAIEKTEALAEQYRTQKRGLMQKLFSGEWQVNSSCTEVKSR